MSHILFGEFFKGKSSLISGELVDPYMNQRVIPSSYTQNTTTIKRATGVAGDSPNQKIGAPILLILYSLLGRLLQYQVLITVLFLLSLGLNSVLTDWLAQLRTNLGKINNGYIIIQVLFLWLEPPRFKTVAELQHEATASHLA